ncbi:MAG: hypothetical protein V2J65_02735, partial [Desulfobacteraceae bacterium]|nr:hypothetical protein [Desulfobacteraceae bacterium]
MEAIGPAFFIGLNNKAPWKMTRVFTLRIDAKRLEKCHSPDNTRPDPTGVFQTRHIGNGTTKHALKVTQIRRKAWT